MSQMWGRCDKINLKTEGEIGRGVALRWREFWADCKVWKVKTRPTHEAQCEEHCWKLSLAVVTAGQMLMCALHIGLSVGHVTLGIQVTWRAGTMHLTWPSLSLFHSTILNIWHSPLGQRNKSPLCLQRVVFDPPHAHAGPVIRTFSFWGGYLSRCFSVTRATSGTGGLCTHNLNK